jgi:WD40 repeat protein
MPRVICQVRARPGRISFVWSEGGRAFEPYHLDGSAVIGLLETARSAREELARIAVGGSGAELPRLGRELYRQLFPQNGAGATVAAEVRTWLAGLEEGGTLESLELLGDHEVAPWNVLCDRAEEAGGQVFWGGRLNVAAGRRAGPLRSCEVLERPTVLLVMDPGSRAALTAEQQKRLHEFIEGNRLAVAQSVTDLGRAIQDNKPDILYLFCQSVSGGLRLGDAVLTAAELEELLRGQEGELPWNSRLVFVNACRGDGAWAPVAASFQALGLGGLILPEAPPAGELASAFGLDFLAGFLYQGRPVGVLLQQLRQRTAPAGLLYTTVCPPWLRVCWQEVEAETAAPEKEAEEAPLPEEPYRPLAPYDREDRALFVGRENDTVLAAGLLDAPGVRLLLVHGRAAIGKSSLLRAGVLPYLELDGVGYRALRDRQDEDIPDEEELPVIAVRATNDLPGQLALALAAACARPCSFTTPTGRTVTVDLPSILRQSFATAEETPPQQLNEAALRAALLADPALPGRLLTALADALPQEPVLLIEQGEEMFTLARRREDAVNRQAGLEMLRRLAATPGQGKVVVLLRTEYYGRLISQLRLNALSPPGEAGLRDYFLTELSEEGMMEAVLQPTLDEPIPYSTEIPLAKYGFRFDEGLPELIVRQVRETARELGESALSLLQVVCTRLAAVAMTRQDRTIHEADVAAAGGISAGLAGYVEELIKTVVSSNSRRRRLRGLLGRLYRSQPDGTVTRDLTPVERLSDWRGPPPLETIIEEGAAEDVRLFETYWLGGGDQEQLYVSLSSDALAPVAARWDREDRIRREHGRKVTIDWLWVVVPLVLLLLVMGWTWQRTRRAASAAQKELEEAQGQVKTWKETLKAVEEGTRFPLYVNHLREAEKAWTRGESVLFRQLLLNHRRDPRPEDDVRGFEWYHLWQLRDRSLATLEGHLGAVAAVTLSADGKLAVSGGSDGRIGLWGLRPTTRLGFVDLRGGPVNAVAFSHSGLLLACGLEDGSLRILDLAGADTGKSKRIAVNVFGSHAGAVRCVALSPDGKVLASGGDDGMVRLWETVSRKDKKVLVQGSRVLAVAFSPDGKLLASSGADGTIILRDGPSGEKKQVLSAHKGPVGSLAFSPDGKLLVSAGTRKVGLQEQGEVKFWDIATGKAEKTEFEAPARVWSLAYVEQGKGLLTGCQDGSIRLWDTTSGKQLETFAGHLGAVRGLAVHSDDKTFISGAADRTVKSWSLSSPGARQQAAAHKGPAVAVAISPDSKRVISGGQDGALKLWDAATGRAIRTLKSEQGPVTSVALAGMGDRLLAASSHAAKDKQGGVILLWDADKGTILHTLKGHKGSVNAVALSADGSLLVSGGADKMVLTWDTAKGTQQQRFTGHSAEVLSVAVAPDKGSAASGDAAGVILVETVGAKKPGPGAGKRLFPDRHAGPVQALAFIKDDAVISGGADGTIRLWVWRPGKEVGASRILTQQRQAVLGLALSGFWDVLAAGGPDQSVHLWDLERGKLRHTLPGPGAAIRGLAFAPNGRLLAAACADGTVYFWRSAPREPLAQPPREREAE